MNSMEQAPRGGERHVDPAARAYYERKIVQEIVHQYEHEQSSDHVSREALDTPVEISTRTALIADVAFHALADRLRRENQEIERVLNGSVPAAHANVENMRATYADNEALLRVLETNCLQTLGPIADRVIFPATTDRKA